MKLKRIKLKSDNLTIAEALICNNDKPTNGECFAELMFELQQLVKDKGCMPPPWLDKKSAIQHIKEQIKDLLAD